MEYIPVTEQEKKEMLAAIGVESAAGLFSVIPESARLDKLDLPAGLSELELTRRFEALSAKNSSLRDHACFCGAGVYKHFIPALVGEIINRSEFLTAYTPYQPEASQGTLQAVFEYQSLIAALTGLDVSNASLYDGASATAEAALLAARSTGRKRVAVSAAVHPEYRQVLATYLQGSDAEITTVPLENGATSFSKIRELAGADTAALIVQSPNFLGIIEDLSAIKDAIKDTGSLFVTVVNPLSLGLLKSPGEAGADITVGEGQVLGNPSGLGGFTFGFMAAKQGFAWKMPGRIVGQTVDTRGRRGFVLTLQSREQHIRREKATSNICTNAALNALAACVYLSGWGPDGIRKLAELNAAKSHYAFDVLSKLPGFSPVFPGRPFFNEFVLKTERDIPELQKKLLSKKIIGPFNLSRFYPAMQNCLLFCATEANTKEEIDRLADVLAK
ncbi:MAG: aminomethyl-transferring glycine dehydrogenase subunit GcvPA [Endomicrobiales bacterium]